MSIGMPSPGNFSVTLTLTFEPVIVKARLTSQLRKVFKTITLEI